MIGPVRDLHLGISKFIRALRGCYLPSVISRTSDAQKGGNLFVKIVAWVLQGYKLLLSAIENDGEFLGTDIDF